MAYTTIDDPSEYFQTVLWSGDNSDSRNITNDGNSDLQPDWVWIKSRNGSGNGYSHNVYDTSRGVSSSINTSLFTDQTDSEGGGDNVTTTAQLGGVSAMLSDGFTVKEGSSTDDARYVNKSGNTYVAWQWKANGGSRTTFTESGNNPGGGRQANTTAGFSIIDYTGTGTEGTVAHGLGAVPHVMIFKRRNSAADWTVYHHKNTSEPATDFLILNEGNATQDVASVFNDTEPTSSVFTVHEAGKVNTDGDTFISYCFTEIQGYSKFGSYKGNGSSTVTNGPFIYTGFKPAWTMIKRSDASSDGWYIHDSTRGPNNVIDKSFRANVNNAESGENIDFLSNGFAIRIGANNNFNNASGTYIYLAFAESPFVSSKGVPTTAR